ncbi:MAG: hypothetical protein ACRD8U_06160 [Pyrinomonadaceae bacterium]
MKTLMLLTLLLSPALTLAQLEQEPIRLRFPRGSDTAFAKGFIGGESTDYYVVRVRAGQKLIVDAISRRKRTQVYVSHAEDDASLTEVEPDRANLTHWEGIAPRTGDYLIRVNVHPYAERYTLKVTVRNVRRR